jgi:hypothetical protein
MVFTKGILYLLCTQGSNGRDLGSQGLRLRRHDVALGLDLRDALLELGSLRAQVQVLALLDATDSDSASQQDGPDPAGQDVENLGDCFHEKLLYEPTIVPSSTQ